MAETTRNMFNNGGVLAPPRTLARARLPRAHRPHRHRRGQALGVSRQALSKLVNGTAGISPEMALRLAKAFGSTLDMWLRLQMASDLAQALKREPEITRDVRRVTIAA